MGAPVLIQLRAVAADPLRRGDAVQFWHPRGGYYLGVVRRLCRRPLRDGRPACWVRLMHGVNRRLILVPMASCKKLVREEQP